MRVLHSGLGGGPAVSAPPLRPILDLPAGRDGVMVLARLLAPSRPADPGFVEEAAADGCDADLRAACAAARTPFGASLEAEVRSGRRMLVFGDYDADGVCATASMVLALVAARSVVRGLAVGRDGGWSDQAYALGVGHEVPERRHGYGLSAAAIRAAAAAGYRTVVACDNGTNAIEALALAQGLGMRVLVVDHHPPSPRSRAWWTPERLALLWNPMAGGPAAAALAAAGPSPEACASFLVDLVAAELLARCGVAGGHPHGAVLAGIATVTDVMPARGANRSAMRTALRMLGSGDCLPGLRQLTREHLVRARVIESPAFDDPHLASAMDAGFLGFDLGPRLNACGRTGEASLAVDLLLASAEDAAPLAARVEAANQSRRSAQRVAWAALLPLVEALGPSGSVLAEMVADVAGSASIARSRMRFLRAPDATALVACVPGVVAIACSTVGDVGVAGLVASSLARALGCPAMFCCMSSVPDDAVACDLAGSGRVPEGSPILAVSTGAVATAVFEACGGSAGGHSAAFGARILVLAGRDRFVAAIRALATRMASGIAMAMAALGPEVLPRLLEGPAEAALPCDLSLPLASLTPALAAAIGLLGPFGPGFAPPSVLVSLPPASFRPMGQGGSFSLDAGQGRGGPRVIGFTGAFPGGVDALRASGVAARVAAEGCSVVGSVRPSYYGFERSGRSWRGPGVDFEARAFAVREPAVLAA